MIFKLNGAPRRRRPRIAPPKWIILPRCKHGDIRGEAEYRDKARDRRRHGRMHKRPEDGKTAGARVEECFALNKFGIWRERDGLSPYDVGTVVY